MRDAIDHPSGQSPRSFSPTDMEEWALQTSVMRPGSPAAVERGKRLSAFLFATSNRVWVGDTLHDMTDVEKKAGSSTDEYRIKKGRRSRSARRG